MNDNDELKVFVDNLHPSAKLVSKGKATVLDREVDAVEIINLYGQRVVWGLFSVNRGKFKGNLANSANTDDVVYKPEE